MAGSGLTSGAEELVKVQLRLGSWLGDRLHWRRFHGRPADVLESYQPWDRSQLETAVISMVANPFRSIKELFAPSSAGG